MDYKTQKIVDQLGREIQECLEENLLGMQVSQNLVYNTKQLVIEIISDTYNCPRDWVYLSNFRLEEDGRKISFDGYSVIDPKVHGN